jgi:hypothetical protein
VTQTRAVVGDVDAQDAGGAPALAGTDVAREWRKPSTLCIAGLIAAGGAILLAFQSGITFFGDEWTFLLERRGWGAGDLLDPHNDHIAIMPALIYKLLLAAFGMDSALPFQVVGTAVFLLSVALLFVYLQRRVGDWVAVLMSTLILFLGAGWIDLLWPFQIGFSGSIAAGLGALLALDRDDRRGDIIACALLVVSLSFSELGVPFVAGALVGILLSRRSRRARYYVVVVPLALYGLWWLGWGHTAESAFSLHNFLVSPKFVFDAASQAAASLFGLATPLSGGGSEPVGLDWGRILLVVGIILAAWRLSRLGRIPGPLWIALAIGGSFWFLTAFNAIPVLRAPTSGRYQYPGAVFLLLIAAELLRGARIAPRTLVAGSTVTAAAVLSGVWFLHLGSSKIMSPASDSLRAELAAFEIARDRVEPGVAVYSIFLPIRAGDYLSAADADGSPAYSESELASSPESARAAADDVLVQSLRIGLGNSQGPGPRGAGEIARSCETVSATGSGEPGLAVGPGEFTLRAQPGLSGEVRIGRFADGLPVSFGSLGPEPLSLAIPADRSARPWRVGIAGNGAVSTCERHRSPVSTDQE